MNDKEAILVVDDTPESLALMVRMLSSAGYQVRPADSGELALESVALSPPDLILLDVRMSGIDGLEVCRRLGAGEATKQIPIILVSAMADMNDFIEGLRLGAVDFISKPFRPEELRTRVGTQLALSQANASLKKQTLALSQVNERLQAEIAERLRAEAALREASLYSRNLLESSLDPLVMISKEGKITDVNTATEKITGLSRERLVGSDFADYFTEPERARAGYRKVFEWGQAVDYQLAMRHTSGAITEVLYNASVCCNEQGEVLGVFAAARDVTEQRRIQAEAERLEAQNRQLQKNESLGRMAAAIAHHFNNQLMVAMMNLEMGLKNNSLGADLAEHMVEARKALKKAAEVSGLMLTYLGHSQCKLAPLDLSDACLQSLPMLRSAMIQGVVLETDIAEPGPVVEADAGQVQQVLSNLVTNAWEAIDSGRGVIRLAVGTVAMEDIPLANRFPIDFHPRQGSYACMEVTDSGCGIAPQDFEMLFDPFFSKKFTGRGLGLAVVLGIVRSHNGVVTVASEPGRGSTFRVYLPASAAMVARKPAPADPARHREASGTVLVVDDEASLRKAVAVAVKAMGFTPLTAQDGAEAVELFRRHAGETLLVICDLTMPRMDGWQTLAALREIAPGIPVILCSGYSEAQALAGQHSELPQAFLSKPYEYEKLCETMGQVLKGK